MRERTTVSIDQRLRNKLESEAKRRGVSVSSIINEALLKRYHENLAKKNEGVPDPVLKRVPFKASIPPKRDLDDHIDEVVYGDQP